MTLKPTDMLVIQSAIDDYERKFRRPAPSAEEALAWRLGKRPTAGVPKVVKPERESAESKLAEPKLAEPIFAEPEDGYLTRAFAQMKLRWNRWTLTNEESSESFENMTPWVRGVLMAGGWSVAAVVTVSLFFFGALVGGFK